MSFVDAMRVVLPPQDGVQPHITGHYREERASGPHGGVDFNYVGGQQAALNQSHPDVHAPISGEVTFVGGQYGTIKIKDSEGNTHEILHTHSQAVATLSRVNAGDVIGTMGGRGPRGAKQYAQHVHYQLKDAGGRNISPVDWWDNRVSVTKSSVGTGEWTYPFSANIDKTDPGTLENIYNDAVSRAADGSYPLGNNGIWHGGIHFDSGTSSSLAQDDGIRSIAKGEIVAYRLDERYQSLKYPHPRFQNAAYSTGFVLVRHVLELPKITPQGEGAPSNGASDAEEPLVFFSLYMHLLDWAGYKESTALKRPAYWQGKKQYRVRAKAPDVQKILMPEMESDDVFCTSVPEPCAEPVILITGQNVRPGINENPVLGLLPAGTLVEIAETNGNWGRISHVIEGGPIAPPSPGGVVGPGAEAGWVYLKEMDAELLPDPLDRVVSLEQPVRVEAGDLLGHVGEYQNFEQAVSTMPARGRRPLMHMEVFAGSDLPTFIRKSRERADKLPESTRTLLVIKPGAKPVQPATPDALIKPGELVAVARGDDDQGPWLMLVRAEKKIVNRNTLNGFNSSTKAYEGGLILHRILGTSDNDEISLADYRKLDRTGKARYTRREVLKSTGEAPWVEREGFKWPASKPIPAWSNYPLQLNNADGPQARWPRVIARAALDRKLGDYKATEGDGTQWWQVTVISGDGAQQADGWVRAKDHPGTAWQSPWHWPGFELVEEDSLTLPDFLARQQWQRGLVQASEEADFKMRAERGNESALFTRLYDILDRDQNEVLTADELRHAYRNPALAQSITRLIVKYESEWGGPMSKWDELDPMALAALPLWQAEKKRIEKLQWWSQVSPPRESYVTQVQELVEGFPKQPTGYHIHPVGLISNFMMKSSARDCCEISAGFLERVFDKAGSWSRGKGGGRAYAARFKDNYSLVYDHDKLKFVEMLNEALRRHGIAGCYQKAHFLSQCFHESAHFETTLEFGTGERYNPGRHRDAVANGNTTVGDGPRYRGRGLIQLTWKNNYKKYSEFRGLDFVAEPDLVASSMYNAIDVSCWYWRNNGGVHKKHDAKGDINKLISAERDNVALVTLAVNGGDNGLAERKALYGRIKREWGLT